MSDELRTAYLGTYDELEVPLVLEVLSDAGITALTKDEPGGSEGGAYPFLHDRGVILVDSARLEDARRVLDEELPKHLEAIAAEMDEIDVGEEGSDGEDS